VLIVLPLGVRQEFNPRRRDARRRSSSSAASAEIDADRHFTSPITRRCATASLIRTHLHGGEPRRGLVLRGFGGTKTFREFMRLFDARGEEVRGPLPVCRDRDAEPERIHRAAGLCAFSA
jgi:broad specificity phosphatase PhoE